MRVVVHGCVRLGLWIYFAKATVVQDSPITLAARTEMEKARTRDAKGREPAARTRYAEEYCRKILLSTPGEI